MRDYNEQIALDNDERIASGSVKVVDYELLVGAKAIGSIDVLSYAELVGVKASGGITITAYASLTGKTVTIGTDVLTEGVGFIAGTDNNTTAESLKDAIHALSGFTATRAGAIVTVVSATAGRAGNLIAMSSNAEAGITFSENSRLMGGKNEGTITVGTDVLTQGVGFTAGTSNAVTAESIKDGIHALAGVTATRATDKVNIEMSAVGVAGNIALSATWDNTSASALTLSGATLTGGRNEGTITVGTDVLTQGTDFTSATDDETTAESVKDAIHALTDISATRTDETVSVVADSAGLAGNLAISSNSAGVEVSGMSGGLDYFYSEVFSYDNISAPSLETSIEVSGLGVAETVDVVLEVSFNSVEWATRHTYDQFTADGTKTALINKPRSFARLKCSVSAGATATVKFNAQTSQQDYEDGATGLTAIAADIALIEGKITACDTGAIVGTVTANAGTDLNTSLLALETGGNLASVKTNTDALATVTKTTVGADIGLDVNVISSAGYDITTDTVKVSEISPLDSHRGRETLCDLTNIAGGTTDYLYFSGETKKVVSILGFISTTVDTIAVTVEVTNQDDSTALASCRWADVTDVLTGSASATASFAWLIDTDVPVYYWRIKYVTTGATNDSNLTIDIDSAY